LIHLPAAQQIAAAAAVLNPAVADPGGSGSRPISPTPAMLAAARQNSGLPAGPAVAGIKICERDRLALAGGFRIRSVPAGRALVLTLGN